MKYYLNVLKNYATLSGRARRKEYWMFALFNLIFLIVAAVIDNVLGTTFKTDSFLYPSGHFPYGWVYLVYGLVVFIPGVAVAVRRLHDQDKSGWYFWVVLIPIAGAIWILVLLCTEGTIGDNKYGPDPKAMERALIIVP